MRLQHASSEDIRFLSTGGFSGWLLIPALLACAALLLPLASLLSAPAQTPQQVPYSLHSVLVADYSSEIAITQYPALEVSILGEAIFDEDSQADDGRVAEILNSLLTPVPTVTPRFPPTATNEPAVQPTAVPTRFIAPRTTAIIPQEPSPTELRTPTAQPTATSRPKSEPSLTPPSPSKPKPTRSAPPPEPTEPPAVPTDPPRPTQPPDPYPKPDPGEPTPNPYP